ncbi:MAG TPA: hypothetical protein PLX89_19135 [Verrucomicrobiota bacterium]|nr:hypothetical protein [Verrucomicrobiota bacterium]
MDLRVESPARVSGTMGPTPAHLVHLAKGGGINGLLAAQATVRYAKAVALLRHSWPFFGRRANL